MSDGVFGVLGGMALADLERSNSRTARHNEEMAGMMEYQGNVAEATLDVARNTLKFSRSALEQGKLNMGAIDRNVREIRTTAGKVDGVRAVVDEAKAVIEDTRTGVRATFEMTNEARNNTRNLMDLVTGIQHTQSQMIDAMERMSKRDEALMQEVHELREQIARSNGPSPD